MTSSRRMRSLALVLPLLPLLTLGAPAHAQGNKPKPTEKPLLWKIEGEGEAPSFLYGTIHVPDDRVLALPEVVEEALDACDAFYGELKLDQGAQMAAMSKMMLPQGKTLKDAVGKDLHERLKAYLNAKGLGMAMMQLERMKPWAVASQLAMLDYIAELQMGKQPLDKALEQRCQQAGKETGGLETIDEQLSCFEGLDGPEQKEQFEQALDQLEQASKEGRRATDPLLQAYLSGEEEKILTAAREGVDPEDPGYKKLMAKLLDGRNQTMTDRIHEKLEANPDKVYFFAIGTLHHFGEKGMVTLLEAKGYKVTRLTPADAGKLVPAGVGK